MTVADQRELECRELARRASAGDVHARDNLALRSLEILTAEAAALIGGAGERSFVGHGGADDIAHDTVLEAVFGPALRHYDPDRQTWRGFIVRRLRWRVLDAWRAEAFEGCRRRLPPQLSGPAEISPNGEDADRERRSATFDFRELRSSEPSLLLQIPEARRLVRRQLLRLRNPFYRRCLILRDFYGHTYAGIAERFGCREGRVRNAVHRARARLGVLLEREEAASDRCGMSRSLRSEGKALSRKGRAGRRNRRCKSVGEDDSPLIIFDSGHHHYGGRYMKTLGAVWKRAERRSPGSAVVLSYRRHAASPGRSPWAAAGKSPVEYERMKIPYQGSRDYLDFFSL